MKSDGIEGIMSLRIWRGGSKQKWHLLLSQKADFDSIPNIYIVADNYL